MTLKPFYLFILLFPVFGITQSFHPSHYQFTHRIQTGIEYDTNIRESLDHPITGKSLRMVVDSRAIIKSKTLRHLFIYNGGHQFYHQASIENKSINEFQAKLQLLKFNKFLMGFDLDSRFKLFFKQKIDYGLYSINPNLRFYISKDLTLYSAIRLEKLDYFSYNVYDYIRPVYYMSLSHQLENFVFSIEYINSTITYNRSAYTYAFHDKKWIELSERQHDMESAFGFFADYYIGKILLNGHYRFEKYRSNSYGFDYHRHSFTFMIASHIGKTLVRIYASLQNKSYLNQLLPFWTLELDKEKEQNNFVVLDLSRALSPVTSVIIRVAFYQNESPYASLFYDKTLLNIGLEFRP